MIDSQQDEQTNLTHTKKLGTLQFEFYCKSQPQLSSLIFKIQNILKESPQFYYHSILIINKGRTIYEIQKRFRRQLQALTENKSFFQIVQKAINARQKCIQKLRVNLVYAQKKSLRLFKKHYFVQNSNNNNNLMNDIEQVQNQGYSTIQVQQQTIQQSIQLLQKVFTDMSRLRDMTIYIVEMVHQWRVKMEEWLDKCGKWEEVMFLYYKHGEQKYQLQLQNVYEKIIKDTQFIWQSTLNEYIFISTINDPFLIRNVLGINQRQQQQKNILEKYFLQFLYPKSEQVIQKAMKCYDMLTFKYVPKVDVLKREEEKLIESYLQVKRRQLEEEGNVGEVDTRQVDWQRDRRRDKELNDQNNRKMSYNPKGLTLRNKLKKPSQQKFKQLIQRHQHKVTFIKPSIVLDNKSNNKLSTTKKNINNYNNLAKTQRTSTLLASLQQTKLGFNTDIIGRFGINSLKNNNSGIIKSRCIRSMSENKLIPTIKRQQKQKMNNNSNSNNHRGELLLMPITTQHPHTIRGIVNNNRNVLYKNNNSCYSLSKLQSSTTMATTIFQHPHQYQCNQHRLRNNNSNQSNQLRQIKAKINQQNPLLLATNVENEQNTRQLHLINQNKEERHQHQNQHQNQQKLSQNQQNKLQTPNTNQQRLSAVRQLINICNNDAIFSSRVKKRSLSVVKRSLSVVKNIREREDSKMAMTKNNNQKSRSLQRLRKKNTIQVNKMPSSSSTGQNVQSSSNQTHQQIKIIKLQNNCIDLPTDNILLNPKSLPHDIIPTFMLHIFNRINPTSKKFLLHNNLQSLTNKLLNPLNHHILFDISSNKRGHIGHVILSQSFSSTNKKLYYTIEFINISVFQLLVLTILKIGEEVLLTTPCEEVRMKVYEDRLDAVSVHFVGLIERTLCENVKKIGCQFLSEQLQIIKLDNIQVTEKILTIKSSLQVKKRKQQGLSQLLLTANNKNNNNNSNKNNYRSLRFQSRCLILGSNFRMRSRTGVKDMVSSYGKVSMGYLYMRMLVGMLTKRHLRVVRGMLLLKSNDNDKSDNSDDSDNNNLNDDDNNEGQQYPLVKKDNNSSNMDLVTSTIRTTKILQTRAADNTKNNNNNNTKNNNNNKKRSIQFIRTMMFTLKEHLLLQKQLQQQQQQNKQKSSSPSSYDIKNNQKHINNTINNINNTINNINITRFTHMPQLLSYLQYKQYRKYFDFTFLQQSRFVLNHQLMLSEFEVEFSLEFIVKQSVGLLMLNNHMGKEVKVISQEYQQQQEQKQQQQQQQQFKIRKIKKTNTRSKCVILPTTNQNIQLCFIDGKEYVKQSLSSQQQIDLFTYLYHYQQKYFHNNNNTKNNKIRINKTQRIINQITIPKLYLNNNQHNKPTINLFNGLFNIFPQRQFYSCSQFKTLYLSQGYYPPAVLYQPQKQQKDSDNIVFEYPLIVGVVDKRSQQIVVGYLFQGDNSQ